MKKREENNHLAMLAVPIVLSMLINVSGFSMNGSAIRSNEQNAQSHKSASADNSTAEKDSNSQRIAAMQTAVDSVDYTAFLNSMQNTPLADVMTETAFNEVVKRYQAYLLV